MNEQEARKAFFEHMQKIMPEGLTLLPIKNIDPDWTGPNLYALCTPDEGHEIKQDQPKAEKLNLRGILGAGEAADQLVGRTKHLPWSVQAEIVIYVAERLADNMQKQRTGPMAEFLRAVNKGVKNWIEMGVEIPF